MLYMDRRCSRCGAVVAFKSYRDRAEKAALELSGNAALRRDLGARDDETMCEFAVRLVRERDEAREEVKQWRLGRARACACVSCEGPLTCARCVPVQTGGSLMALSNRLVDAEARLKELADKCDSLLGRVQLLEGKTRNLGGDGKWHVDSSLTKTGPTLKPTPPVNMAQKLKDARAALTCRNCGGIGGAHAGMRRRAGAYRVKSRERAAARPDAELRGGDLMKTPRDIAHEALVGLGLGPGGSVTKVEVECAKRGMVEALRWMIQGFYADPSEFHCIEAKLAELEKS